MSITPIQKLIDGFRELGLVETDTGDSISLVIPTKGQFLQTLPKKGATLQARLFINTLKILKDGLKMRKVPNDGKWMFHTSGKVTFNSSPPRQKKVPPLSFQSTGWKTNYREIRVRST